MDEPGRHHNKASQLQNDMYCMFSLKCYIQQPDSKRSHHCQDHRGEMQLLLMSPVPILKKDTLCDALL